MSTFAASFPLTQKSHVITGVLVPMRRDAEVVALPETLPLALGAEVEIEVSPFLDAIVMKTQVQGGEAAILALRRDGGSVRRALSRAGLEDLWIGIAMPQALTSHAMKVAVEEARAAVTIGSQLWVEPRVVLYEDVLPFSALLHVPPLLARLVNVLRPVIVHDQRRRTQLMRTLAVVVDAPNSTAAAKTLGIHRHTLEYRLRQLESITGRSLRAGSDRFLIEVALAACRLTEEFRCLVT